MLQEIVNLILLWVGFSFAYQSIAPFRAYIDNFFEVDEDGPYVRIVERHVHHWHRVPPREAYNRKPRHVIHDDW